MKNLRNWLELYWLYNTILNFETEYKKYNKITIMRNFLGSKFLNLKKRGFYIKKHCRSKS